MQNLGLYMYMLLLGQFYYRTENGLLPWQNSTLSISISTMSQITCDITLKTWTFQGPVSWSDELVLLIQEAGLAVLEIKKISKLSLFQMQDNLTPGSGCPDDCLVALKILYNLLLS